MLFGILHEFISTKPKTFATVIPSNITVYWHNLASFFEFLWSSMFLFSYVSGYCFSVYGIDFLFPFDWDLSQYFFYRILSLVYILPGTMSSIPMTLVTIKIMILKFMGVSRLFRRHIWLRDWFRIFRKNFTWPQCAIINFYLFIKKNGH